MKLFVTLAVGLFLLVIPSCASELIVALVFTCVEDDCTKAPAAVAAMLKLPERDLSSRVLESGQLELWFSAPNNQTLFQQFLVMSKKTDQNQPLGAASISKIGVTYATSAPQPAQTELVTENPSNMSRADVVPTSRGLETGPIVGISVSLVVVLFASLFAFSKWYMWRYAKKHNYVASEELDTQQAAEPERATMEESVVAPRAVSFATPTRKVEEEVNSRELGEAKNESDRVVDDLEFVFDAE
jgi:hypothetical protein